MPTFPVAATFTDDFNRANQNPIGSPWAKADTGASVVSAAINANEFRPAAGTSSILMCYLTTFTTLQDIDCWYDITRLPTGSQRYRILGRIQSPGGVSSGYYAEYANNSGSPFLNIGTYTRVATNPSFTSQANSGTITALSVGDALGFRITGYTLEVYVRRSGTWDSSPEASWADPSTLYASGPVGMSGNSTALSSQGDNFNLADRGGSITRTPRASAVDFGAIGLMTKAFTRRRSGIFVPRLWVPAPAVI